MVLIIKTKRPWVAESRECLFLNQDGGRVERDLIGDVESEMQPDQLYERLTNCAEVERQKIAELALVASQSVLGRGGDDE